MIRAVIVENEPPNAELLTSILAAHFPEIELLGICETVLSATALINNTKPDLVFLDVELDVAEGGFTVLEHTRMVNFEVIFTTSHREHALRAFEFCALHYLLRPFGVDEIRTAMNRFQDKLDKGSKKSIDALLHNRHHENNLAVHQIGIPVVGGIDFISLPDVILCKAENNCTDFYLVGGKKITATKTLKWVDDLMSSHLFYRVHDSYLINLNHIRKYKRGGEGGVVELTEGFEVDVSRRKKESFLQTLARLNIIPPR